jgi:hypothetical protein
MMKSGPIGEHDSLFRHVVFPLAFRGGAFQWDKGMKLWDQPDGTVLASLAWERFVPTIAEIHGYGCRLAFQMTEKERKKDRYREKDRRIYCGAYQFKASRIRALARSDGLDDVLSADVTHHIEEGEIAHTDLRFTVSEEPRFDIEGTKTAILVRLWQACSGPLIHKCSYDDDILDHPGSALPTPPSGPYKDMRSSFQRIWYLLRFKLIYRLWTAGYINFRMT